MFLGPNSTGKSVHFLGPLGRLSRPPGLFQVFPAPRFEPQVLKSRPRGGPTKTLASDLIPEGHQARHEEPGHPKGHHRTWSRTPQQMSGKGRTILGFNLGLLVVLEACF